MPEASTAGDYFSTAGWSLLLAEIERKAAGLARFGVAGPEQLLVAACIEERRRHYLSKPSEPRRARVLEDALTAMRRVIEDQLLPQIARLSAARLAGLENREKTLRDATAFAVKRAVDLGQRRLKDKDPNKVDSLDPKEFLRDAEAAGVAYVDGAFARQAATLRPGVPARVAADARRRLLQDARRLLAKEFSDIMSLLEKQEESKKFFDLKRQRLKEPKKLFAGKGRKVLTSNIVKDLPAERPWVPWPQLGKQVKDAGRDSILCAWNKFGVGEPKTWIEYVRVPMRDAMFQRLARAGSDVAFKRLADEYAKPYAPSPREDGASTRRPRQWRGEFGAHPLPNKGGEPLGDEYATLTRCKQAVFRAIFGPFDASKGLFAAYVSRAVEYARFERDDDPMSKERAKDLTQWEAWEEELRRRSAMSRWKAWEEEPRRRIALSRSSDLRLYLMRDPTRWEIAELCAMQDHDWAIRFENTSDVVKFVEQELLPGRGMRQRASLEQLQGWSPSNGGTEDPYGSLPSSGCEPRDDDDSPPNGSEADRQDGVPDGDGVSGEEAWDTGFAVRPSVEGQIGPARRLDELIRQVEDPELELLLRLRMEDSRVEEKQHAFLVNIGRRGTVRAVQAALARRLGRNPSRAELQDVLRQIGGPALKDRGVARPFKRKLPEAERLRYLNLKRNSFVAALRWHREEQAELARLLYDSLLGLQKAIVKKLEEGLKRPAHNYEAAKELAGIPPPMATSDQRRAAVAKADGIWEARIAEICRIAPSSRLPPSPSLKPATGIQTRLKVWRWIRTLGPRKKPGPKNGATKRAKATGRNATEGEASRSKKVASKQHGKMRDGARSRSRARAGKIGA